jgi:site-specific DNA-methyltransferase (adenine-specific)
MERFLSDKIALHCGDCLAVLATLPENSVDSCVTDPPYHLTSIVKRFGNPNSAPVKIKKIDGQGGSPFARGAKGFMGKQWDGGEIAFEPETWAAVLRVLKPGAHLAAFGAPKNFGFMQNAIAWGGFEVRDVIAWLFGSGFPKSHNLGNGWGTALKPAYEPVILARKPLIGTVAENVKRYGTGAINVDGCRVETESGWQEWVKKTARPNSAGKEHIGDVMNRPPNPTVNVSDLGRWPANVIHDGSEEVVAAFPDAPGQLAAVGPHNGAKPSVNTYGDYGPRNQFEPRNDTGSAARFFYQVKQDDPCHSINFASDAGERFDLKSEHVVSALSNAVAASMPQSVLQKQSYRAQDMSVSVQHLKIVCESVIEAIQNLERRSWLGLEQESTTVRLGPVTCAATRKQTGITTITLSLWKSARSVEAATFNITETSAAVGEAVCANRLFYTAKADSDDRIGSKHPTVKPLDLMQYLVRLITPKGGIVLDPFAGTGTTGEAAFREGMGAILIEREEEYQNDIRRRIALCMAGPDERRRESIKAALKDKPLDLGPLFDGGTG